MDWNSRRVIAIIEAGLREDHALSDTTTLLTIDPRQEAQATILAKQDCVLAGLGLIAKVFEVFASFAVKEWKQAQLPPVLVKSSPEVFDGARMRSGETVAVIRGLARELLSCERLTVNFLQRMSGIATMTRAFVDAVHGAPVRILDTRKTNPGLRILEKYAVTCGGGYNHRTDLSAGILIKNNHIALAGNITRAISRAKKYRVSDQLIEVEVRSLEELDEALKAGADRILLDNMSVAQVRKAVERAGGIALEVSGGITLENVRAYAETGVNFISVGALTHSAPAVDLSMRIISA